MTYEVGGRQYLVVVAGGHRFMKTPVGDAVVAYAFGRGPAVLAAGLSAVLAYWTFVEPRFGIEVRLGSAAPPFGYQTNVLVYQIGRYSYLDFVKIGVPLNLLTWAVGVAVIPYYFPF